MNILKMEQTKDFEIVIDHKESFMYRNEKGKWLVLKVEAINKTEQPQTTGYVFSPGNFCENIKMPAPKVQKGKHILPLSPKTITATFVDEPFQMEPREKREDTLVVTNLEEDRDWHVGIGDTGTLVEKEKLQYKTKL